MPMKKLVLIIMLFLAVPLYSQEIPLPLNCFPLNGTNSEDIISGQMADIHGSVYALADRFGIKGKAISFAKKDSYFSFPITETSFQDKKEFTFTYWMYAGKDSITQAFWAKDRDDNLLLGMGKKGARPVLNIYHENRQQSVLPDLQWMWSDSNFDGGNGWYFVAIAYANDGTHFYMVTPKGSMTECYSAFAPDWNLISSIGVGGIDDIPATGMDDFKVYDKALSKEQVSILYRSESQLSTGDDTLINVETSNSLNFSTWYFHCVGLQETLQYTLQNQSDLSFLSADDGYSLSSMPDMESNNQKWILSLVKDTSKGHIFTISNCATGMNLTDMCEKTLQQVPDNTNYQKWSIGQIDSDYQIRNIVKKNTPLPLYEEIYFDKSLGVIRVRINFPEVQNVKIKLMTPLGVLLNDFSFTNVQTLEKEFQSQANGIYLVTVESDNYRFSKKVFVDK